MPKKEVKDIQFLKQVIACMKTYTLDCEDVRQAMKVITNVSKEVAQGRNYLIFPEGTRSKKGNTISPVKVQVHFLKPLYYEDYKDMNTKEIPVMWREK